MTNIMQPSSMALRALRRLALQSTTPSLRPATRSLGRFNTTIPRCPAALPRFARPYSSTAPVSSTSSGQEEAAPKQPRPEYELHFTCKPCGTRSKHTISKQAYHKGSVLVQCPECKNRHVIADHLKIFLDRSMTVEDLMKERGQLVKKGTLSQDGDLEFWEDGTTTPRETSGEK